MKTLALLTILDIDLLTTPLAVEAQQAGKGYHIGHLARFAPPGLWDAFVNGLREHGYVEGQNLIIERRLSEGKA